MSPASNFTNGITAATDTRTVASEASLLAPESTLFSEQATPMPCSSGANSSTTRSRSRRASTAPSSETKRPTAIGHQTLSDRLTPSLIAAGLVKGTTPMSIRKQSGAAIRASALWPLDGDALAERAAGSSSLSDEPLTQREAVRG